MENNEVKNEMMIVESENNLISNDASILENSVKKFTTIDLTTEDGQAKLLNAMQNCDIKLNDVVGQVIEVEGIYIACYPSEYVDEKTGEVKSRNKYVTMLFDTEGKSYVTGSNSCYNSMKDIASIKGFPSKTNVYKLKPIKVNANIQGHSFLKLSIVL